MGSHALIYAVVALAISAACLFAGFSWGRSNVKAQIEQAVEKEHVALDAREFAMRTQLEDAIAEVSRLRPLAEELGRVQKRLEREQAKYAQMKAEFNASLGNTDESPAEDSSDAEAQLAESRESADEAIQKLLQSLEVLNNPDAAADAEPLLGEAPVVPSPAPVTAPVAAVPQTAAVPEPARAAVPSKPQAVAQAPVPKPIPAPVTAPVPAPATARAPIPAQPKPPVSAVPPPQKPVAPTAAAATKPTAPQPLKAAPPAPRPPVSNAPATPAANPASNQASKQASKQGQQVDEWQEFARQLEALTGKKK